VAGETEVGKTLIALEVCSALTTGNPLWGDENLTPTMKANKILYVLGEHYNEVIQRLWRKTQLPMSENVWLIGPDKLSSDKWLVANGKTNMTAVDKFSKWAEGADLIIFDPLAAFVAGVDVENDNAQMRAVLDTMSLISQVSGSACMILAHQGKPQMDQYGQERSRKKYAIRGASAIEDAATNIFYMGRGETKDDTKDHKVYVLTKRKYKGEAPDEFRIARDPETLCHTLLGNRPFVEVRKISTQAMVGRVRHAFPDMKAGQIYKLISSVTGMSERSVERYMEGT
jgi:RecA-family ATPase